MGISGGNGGGGGAGGGTANPPSAAVEIVNFAFQPASVTIRPGGSVTWTWSSDTTSHNVTFTDGVQNAATRNSGTHTRTFAAAGTYPYRCTLHASMIGSVLVQ
jgi:plastocyanin